MSQTGWTDKRPMSPHMQVWRWHITMLGSILHRATGMASYVGAMLIVGWLFAAASGPDAYAAYSGLLGSIVGQLLLFGFTLAICYHLLNGLRHLFWDAGTGFTPAVASATGWAVLIASVLLAVAIWIAAGLIPGVPGLSLSFQVLGGAK